MNNLMHFSGGSLGPEIVPVSSTSTKSLASLWSYLNTTMPAGAGNLVALYQFDGTDDSLVDRGENGYNLNSIVPASADLSYVYRENLIGLDFNNDSASFSRAIRLKRTGAESALNTAGAITVEYILAINTFSCNQHMVLGMCSLSSDLNNVWRNYLENSMGNMVFMWTNGDNLGYETVSSGAIPPLGQICYLAFSRRSDMDECRFFIDGILADEVAQVENAPTPSEPAQLCIGRNPSNVSSWCFNGTMFSVRISDGYFTEAMAAEAFASVRSP